MSDAANVTTVQQIIVRTQFEGIHCWPGAPDSVAFLRSPHRHLFKVTAIFPVTHSDRQLEFFTVKDKLEESVGILQRALKNNPHYSCEMMADCIGKDMINIGFKPQAVFVSEDGENDGVTLFFYQ